MTTTVTAWTATHTGLPSFHVLTTEAIVVTSAGRVVARLSAGEHLFSDPGASPGQNTYLIGGVEHDVDRDGGSLAEAIFTDARGRGVAGLLYRENADPIAFSPDVTVFNRHVTRWALETPPLTGAGVLVLTDLDREPDVWRVCTVRSAVILAPSRVTLDDPLRLVVITAVRRKRLLPTGWLEFEISWQETSMTPAPAPVVTWGEWADLEEGWQDLSAVEVAQDVAGMP